MRDRLIDGLSRIPHSVLNGDRNCRLPGNVSFCFEGIEGESLLLLLDGKGGGYRLTRRPEEYRIGDILRLTEGDLAPVACLECNAQPCSKTADCRTRPMWAKLNAVINEYLDSVTVADLMKNQL